MAVEKIKNIIQPERKSKRPSARRRCKLKITAERKKAYRTISQTDKVMNRNKILLPIENRMLQSYEVDPAEIPLSTTEEKEELLKILEEAEISGEINLSRFSIPVET